jgi:hypothetical protein
MITVSYELAQRMKNKGWEQETEFYYRQSVKKEPRHRDNIVEFVDLDVFMSAPTADEIAEALKADFIQFTVKYTLYETEPVFAYTIFTNNDIPNQPEKGTVFIPMRKGVGTNIAEAIGELWCKIKEDK